MLTGGYHLEILFRKNIHHVQSVYNAKIIYVRSRVHYTVFMYALRRYTRLAQGLYALLSYARYHIFLPTSLFLYPLESTTLMLYTSDSNSPQEEF